MADLEKWINGVFTSYAGLVLDKLKTSKSVEDAERRCYALNNINTLIPEKPAHKFNVKEELSKLDDAVTNGYADEEEEGPVDLMRLYRQF